MNIEFESEKTVEAKHSWRNTNTVKHSYALHKLIISKIKANLEYEGEELETVVNHVSLFKEFLLLPFVIHVFL